MPRLVCWSLALPLCALACTPTAPASSPPPPPPDPAPVFLVVSAPASESPGVTATLIDSGWGSSGVVAADAPIPYWVMVQLELQTARDVAQLELVDVELFDADRRRLGRADRELELLVQPANATLGTPPTHPFAGRLEAGRPVRMRLRGRMEDAFGERISTPPVSHRITLQTDAGAIIRISGTIGPAWSTG